MVQRPPVGCGVVLKTEVPYSGGDSSPQGNTSRPDAGARPFLPFGTSLLLDVVRFLAAVTVVVGHATQPVFTSHLPSLSIFGELAVGLFFVLSGYVIQYTVESRESNWRSYARARLARIYSVLAPALVLTLGLGILGQRLHPGYYQAWADSYSNPVLRSLLNLFCLTECHGSNTILMGNDPLWSLGYEVPFYTIFGFLQFAKPAVKWLGLAMCALIYGGNILILFPCWYAGVYLFKALKGRSIATGLGTLCLLCALPAALLGAAMRLYWKNHAPQPSPALQPLFQEIFGGKTSYWPTMVGGGLATILIILWAAAHQEWLIRALEPHTKTIRLLGSGTFAIYVFHYPILMFLGSLGAFPAGKLFSPLALLAITLAVCFGLSRFTETRKGAYARWFARFV